MPDTTGYLDRIRELAGAKDPISALAKSADDIAAIISGVDAERLTRHPAPDKWSVAEILAHLAEDEIATAWRYRQMVEHSGISLAGFDQDLWAKLGDYSSRDPQDSLELYRLLRHANLQFLRSLTPDQWECFGVHAERGRITIRELATHMTGHDANHIRQIRIILE